jgi:lipopolysaccharide exporter
MIFRKGGFTANVLTLVTGTGLAQGLAIAATPILTRLYKPEDFGLLALFLSLTGILSVIANGCYELAIVLPADDRDGINVFGLAILIVLGMSGLSLLVVAFCRDAIARLMNSPDLAPWLWCVPLSLLMTGCFQALTNWNTRKKQFTLQAVARVGQSVGTVGTQTGAALFPFTGASGLIIGTMAGQIIGTGILGERVWRQERQLVAEGVSLRAMWQQAVRYKKFLFLTNLGGLVNQIAYQIPIWLLATFYGPHIAGFYLLAQRAAYLPASLVGASVSQVFFERAALEKKQTGSSIQTFKRTALLMALLAFFPYLILLIWGPPLFALVFGEGWAQAGWFAAILAPTFAISFITRPLSLIPCIHEKQEIALIWQSGLALLSALSILGARKFYVEINSILIVFSSVLFIWYVLLFFIVDKIARAKAIAA